MPLFTDRRSSASISYSVPLNDTSSEEEEPESTVQEVPCGTVQEVPNTRSKKRRNLGLLGRLRCFQKPPQINPGDYHNHNFMPPPSIPREITTCQHRRRAAVFCGFCDMRIASVLLNVLHMSVAIIVEISEASKWGNRNYFEEPPILLLMVLACSGVGMLGALHFGPSAVLFSSIGLCGLSYLYFAEMKLLGLVLACSIIAAQLVLFLEMMCGIMTPDTYAMEEYIDDDGRKILETVHGLSVDIGETAVEFAEEVAIAMDQQKPDSSSSSTSSASSSSMRRDGNEEC